MIHTFYGTLFLLLAVIPTVAQDLSPQDSLAHEKFMAMVNANREQSYVTLGNGIGNIEPLIVESRISPSYFFSKRHKKWAVMISPQVQVRILNERSFPIRNPSYHIYGTFFHEIELWKKTFLRNIFYKNALGYVSYVHHSNGQAGPFYLNDSTKQINLDAGDFSTDFIDFGVSSYRIESLGKNYYSIREVKLSFEYHPEKWASEGLKDRYGFYRIFGTIGILGPHKRDLESSKLVSFIQRSSIELKTGWIFGQMINVAFPEASKRLVIDFWYKYYPPWFDEIAFFMRFYRGQDYYNIHFVNEPLTNLSFGITSNTMNYKQVVKLFGGK